LSLTSLLFELIKKERAPAIGAAACSSRNPAVIAFALDPWLCAPAFQQVCPAVFRLEFLEETKWEFCFLKIWVKSARLLDFFR